MMTTNAPVVLTPSRVEAATQEVGYATQRPQLFVPIGTAAVNIARSMTAAHKSCLGCEPPQVVVRGIDSTEQSADPELPLLSDECYFNLAAGEFLQDRLQNAMNHPRRSLWIPEVATRMSLGDGAGGIAAVALVLVEEQLPQLSRAFNRALRQFKDQPRADMMAKANALPWMREHRLRIEDPAACDVDVIFVASSTGGTVGVLLYLARVLRARMQALGMNPDFTLFLVPPAADEVAGPTTWQKLRNFYRTISEVADQQAGIIPPWVTDDEVFDDARSLFSYVYLLPEPSVTSLDRELKQSGWLLSKLMHPVGMELKRRAIDCQSGFSSRGPNGQQKFLSSINAVKIQSTAFADVSGYATAKLGCQLTARTSAEKDAGVNAAAGWIEASGLSKLAIEAGLPRLEAREVPPGSKPAQEATILESMKRAVDAAAAKAVPAAVADVMRSGTQMVESLSEKLTQLAEEHGIEAVTGATGELARRISDLRLLAQNQQGFFQSQNVASLSDSLTDRWRAQHACCARAAGVRYYAEIDKRLVKLAQSVNHWDARAIAISERLQTLAIESKERLTKFPVELAATHALLDVPALNEIIQRDEPACVTASRSLLAKALQEPAAAEQLLVRLRELIAQTSAPLREVANWQRAWSAAGSRAQIVLMNAFHAALPGVLTDPLWDKQRHVHPFCFIELPDDHEALKMLRLKGRQVRAVAGISDQEVTLLNVDFGFEVCAFQCVHRAVTAFYENDSPFPPFADRCHEPACDLVVPKGDERWAYVAIPLHLALRTGTLAFDEFGGWRFRQTPLERSRWQASEALRRIVQRDVGLPSLKVLATETRQLLEDRSLDEVLKLLNEIEGRLTGEIGRVRNRMTENMAVETDHKSWRQLSSERSAIRAVRREYQAQQVQLLDHRATWEQSITQTDHTTRPPMNRIATEPDKTEVPEPKPQERRNGHAGHRA